MRTSYVDNMGKLVILEVERACLYCHRTIPAGDWAEAPKLHTVSRTYRAMD